MDAQVSKSFLAKLADVFEVDANTVTPDFPLAARWDSVAVLTAIALIDEQFDVTVPPDELTRCASAADVLALVDQSVGLRAPGR
ncbi:MAG: acyl carrier protein [Chloroflexi bacterium]|nr:MAG: acyl carrier protein [Chloroflexota bacterium]